MELSTIIENYNDKLLEIQKVKDRIEIREAQIDRLEKKKYRLLEKSHWTDLLIRPTMELIKRRFPQLTWDDERLVPMGMCCRVSVFAKVNDKTVAMIGFTPSANGLSFDISKRNCDYMQDPNGFSIKSKELTNIDDLFNHIEKQLEENLDN